LRKINDYGNNLKQDSRNKPHAKPSFKERLHPSYRLRTSNIRNDSQLIRTRSASSFTPKRFTPVTQIVLSVIAYSQSASYYHEREPD
jgi:hypothetical protein